MSDTAALPAQPAATAGGDTVLSAKGLVRRYRMGSETLQILRGVDLELRHGETVAVMGRSGAGKSTLLHQLGLLDRPDEGSLTVAGVDAVRLSVRARARLRNRQIGFVFQFYHLLSELNALENAVLPLMIREDLRGWSRRGRAARQRAAQLLDELGLGHRLKHRPSQLSGGERQRVAIARALVADPGVLLCDEPTGNLDERTSEVIADQLLNLARRHGHALIMVTHDPELAERADRTLMLHDGRLEAP